MVERTSPTWRFWPGWIKGLSQEQAGCLVAAWVRGRLKLDRWGPVVIREAPA